MPGEAELQIHITDKNDNAPYFKKRSYTANIPENADIGSVVIAVTAEDSDEGMAKRLTVQIFTSCNLSQVLLLLSAFKKYLWRQFMFTTVKFFTQAILCLTQ